MKLLAVFAICIVAASAYVRRPIQQNKTQFDLADLVQLDQKVLVQQFLDYADVIPVQKFVDLVTKYVEEDEEVQRHWNYIFTAAFKESVADVEKTPEFRLFLDFMDKSGLDMYTYINSANEMLGLEPIVKDKDNKDKDDDKKDSEEKDGEKKDSEEKDGEKKDSEDKDDDKKDSEEKEVPETYKIGEGMAGLIADFKAAMPYEKIYAKHDKKMMNECPYALFGNRVFSKDFATILHNLFHTESFIQLVNTAVAHNIDVVRVRELAHVMMGIDRDEN